MNKKNDISLKGLLDESFPKNSENEILLRKAHWNALFNGARKLKLSNQELSEITLISYDLIEEWYTDKEKMLPLSGLTLGLGGAIKQFLDLYINLRSLYVDLEAPAAWLRKTNPSLKNKTPLDFMKDEYSGIFQVNTYLKSLALPE